MNFQNFEHEFSFQSRAIERATIDKLLNDFLSNGGTITRISLSASEMIRQHYKKWTSKSGRQFVEHEMYAKKQSKPRKRRINKYALPHSKTITGETLNDNRHRI